MTYEEELRSINENLVKQIGARKQHLLERKEYLHSLREKKKEIVKARTEAMKQILNSFTSHDDISGNKFSISSKVIGVDIP